MRVLIISEPNLITSYSQDHLAKIRKVLPQAAVTLVNQENSKKFLEEAEVLIASPVNFNLDLAQAKKLRWMHATSAGVTNLAKLLRDTDIILTNSSGVHPIPIAEHVFGMILMFSRRLFRAYRYQIENKKWLRDTSTLDATEISGKTLGIVGYGRIGERIAQVAKGFEMIVVALEHRSKIANPNVDKVYTKIEDLLKEADFVVNCLPLTDETLGYFDLNKFKQMKPSAFFVNIGRGSTVVEKDLVTALQHGLIAGSGLDVFETEPLPSESPLWNLDNVIISPHFSGWTPKYTERVVEIFCENLKNYLSGQRMPNLVDKDKGY
jgi:phosphoglycerate dehydrogenase-like enzyme